VQECDVALKILLRLLKNPLFKVYEIKSMRILYLFCLQPLNEKRKMIRNLLSVEYPVYHMTTKQSHFNFVTSMRVYLSVLVNRLENIGGG
jgi:hypothetical protein